MRNSIIVGFFLGGVVVACSADPYGDKPDLTEDKSTAAPEGGGSCSKPIEGKDPTTLPECTGTKGVKGRCVPRTELGSFKDTFEQASCPAENGCIPDELVKNGTNIQLKTCKAITDVEGRCFWPLAKDIIESYDLLKGATKDQCAPDQVCAPCVHPLTKQPTGVCSAPGGGGDCSEGASTTKPPAAAATCPQKDPILDTKAFTVEDCGSGMLCVDAKLVGENAKMLKKCAKGVCAPKKAVERAGNYVPPTCRSTANAEGRCMNVNIPQIGEQKNILPKGENCDADEVCAPCFDPRDGKPTGACSIASCDKPKEPAKTFAPCCQGRARCVPKEAVGEESASKLNADSCTADTPLCAPVELIPIPGTPVKKCTSLGFVGGICVSKCAINMFGSGLVKGDCEGDDICAPCRLLPEGTEACK